MAKKKSGDVIDWKKPRSSAAARFLDEWRHESALLEAIAREFGKLERDDFRREVVEVGVRKILNSRVWSASRLGVSIDVPKTVREFSGFKK